MMSINLENKICYLVKFYQLFMLVFLISANQSALAQEFVFTDTNNTRDKIPFTQDKGDFLIGYHSGVGSISNTKCLNVKNADQHAEYTHLGQSDMLYVDTGNSLEKLATNSHQHASASFGYGSFSGSAAYDQIKKRLISNYSEYLRAVVTVESGARKHSLDDLELNEMGQEAIKNGTFYRQCGDKFIIGLISGGSVDVTFYLNASNSEEQNQLKRELSASYKGLSSSAKVGLSFFESIEKTLTTNKATYSILRQGPNSSYPNGSIKDILEYIQNFPTTVKGKEWPTEWIVSSYAQFLPLGYKESSTSPFTYELLIDHAKLSRAMADYLASLAYIRDHPDQFGDFDISLLKTDYLHIENTFKSHSRLVVKCLSDWDDGNCSTLINDYPTNFVVAGFMPPERPKEIEIKVPHALAGEFQTTLNQSLIAEFKGNITHNSQVFTPNSGTYWLTVIDRDTNVITGHFQYSGPTLIMPNRRVIYSVHATQYNGDSQQLAILCKPGTSSFPAYYSGSSNARLITYNPQRWNYNLKSDNARSPLCGR